MAPERRPSSRSPARISDRQLAARAVRSAVTEAEGVPGGTARRLDELDEDAVARARVEECDGPLGASPRRAVDQLDAVDAEPRQRRSQVGHLEADVVKTLALRGEV